MCKYRTCHCYLLYLSRPVLGVTTRVRRLIDGTSDHQVAVTSTETVADVKYQYGILA